MADITAPMFSTIAAECLPALIESTRWLKAAGTNFSADFGKLNQTVNVIAAGTPSAAREFSHTTGYGSTDGSLISTSLQLKKRFISENTMTDADYADISPAVMTQLITASIRSVASGIAKYAVGFATEAAVATKVEVDPATFNASNLNELRRAVVAANLPAESVAAVLNPVLYTGLITDERIARSSVVSVAESALVQGKVARVSGWNLYEAPAFPDNGEKLCGLILHPSALAVAARPVETPGAELFEVITDEETGLSISVKVIPDQMHAKVSVAVEAFVGAALVQPKAALRIVEKTAVDAGG